MTEYISKLLVKATFSSTLSIPGYQRINTDLNRGSGGLFVYIFYQKTSSKEDAITGIKVVAGGRNVSTPDCYFKISTDCNSWSGGAYVYVFYTQQDGGQPITEIEVISGTNQDVMPLSSDECNRIDTNLNEGSGGLYIYLCYKTENTEALEASLEPVAEPVKQSPNMNISKTLTEAEAIELKPTLIPEPIPVPENSEVVLKSLPTELEVNYATFPLSEEHSECRLESSNHSKIHVPIIPDPIKESNSGTNFESDFGSKFDSDSDSDSDYNPDYCGLDPCRCIFI